MEKNDFSEAAIIITFLIILCVSMMVKIYFLMETSEAQKNKIIELELNLLTLEVDKTQQETEDIGRFRIYSHPDKISLEYDPNGPWILSTIIENEKEVGINIRLID
jgi:hypothetical protein